MINSSLVISELKLKPFGQKGWMNGDVGCPQCGRSDKFGILFVDNSGVTSCFYCGESWPLVYVLKSIGRQDLIGFDYSVYKEKELDDLEPEIEKETKVQECKLPIGFRRITNHPYLEERGFTNYEKYQVGISNLEKGLSGKIIFQLFRDGIPVGWVARSTQTKEWHKNNLKRHKEYGDELVLRYKNSNNDFTKILGGIDDITPNTETLILVEGLFDKENTDRQLLLDRSDVTKCCFTFGDSIHPDQIQLIPRNVKNVVLLYDANTLRNMRNAGDMLYSKFELYIGVIKDEDKDPGNMSKKDFYDVFSNLTDFVKFYSTIL